MEAVVDAAVAAGVFAIAVGLVAFFGLSGGISYLNYSEDALVRTEARAVANMIKGLIARSSYNLHNLNPSYSNTKFIDVKGFKINFVAKVKFTQSVNIYGTSVTLSYPSEYRVCPTKQGGVAVTRYSVDVKGLELYPSLVNLDRSGKVTISEEATVCSFNGVLQVAEGETISVFSLDMPAVVYTDSKYYVLPPAYPTAVIAVVLKPPWMEGEYVEPVNVKIPSDAAYLSETTLLENGVNLVVEVWAWTGGQG
jgi:hypothetical protein